MRPRRAGGGGDLLLGSLVRAVLDATEATAARLRPGELDAMRQHFLVTSRYEWMFWEMGYHRGFWLL
jgi:thiaminase/transcriptional activator TenA